jgi:putative membrane protein
LVLAGLRRLSSRPVQGPGNFEPAPPSGGRFDQAGDATRRTYLANERTQLAWWRTGLTALAVSVAVGRVVPELSDSSTTWPYATVGVGFALYGVAMFAYGSMRARAVDESVRSGGFAGPDRAWLTALTAAGLVLGVLTAILVIAE